MLKEEVFTNTAMTLAYVLGFCSVLRARIGENEGLCNLIVCLSGKSTTGKTTALNLIGSIWGDVSEMSYEITGARAVFKHNVVVFMVIQSYGTTYLQTRPLRLMTLFMKNRKEHRKLWQSKMVMLTLRGWVIRVLS